MGIKEWLIPQDKKFFALLDEESDYVVLGAQKLFSLLTKFKNVAKERKLLKDIEHKADDIVHQVYEKLSQTFITPIDQEDIARLAYLYDNVIDHIYAVGNLLYLYKIKKPTSAMKKFAQIILKQTKEIDLALNLLKKLDRKKIISSCIEVHRLENLADKLLDKTTVSLFRGNNIKEIIKLKEIYNLLEVATDKCEEVSDLLRNILMKNI